MSGSRTGVTLFRDLESSNQPCRFLLLCPVFVYLESVDGSGRSVFTLPIFSLSFHHNPLIPQCIINAVNLGHGQKFAFDLAKPPAIASCSVPQPEEKPTIGTARIFEIVSVPVSANMYYILSHTLKIAKH